MPEAAAHAISCAATRGVVADAGFFGQRNDRDSGSRRQYNSAAPRTTRRCCIRIFHGIQKTAVVTQESYACNQHFEFESRVLMIVSTKPRRSNDASPAAAAHQQLLIFDMLPKSPSPALLTALLPPALLSSSVAGASVEKNTPRNT